MVEFMGRARLARSRCCYMCVNYDPLKKSCFLERFAEEFLHKEPSNVRPESECKRDNDGRGFDLDWNLLFRGKRTLAMARSECDKADQKRNRRISRINPSDLED